MMARAYSVWADCDHSPKAEGVGLWGSFFPLLFPSMRNPSPQNAAAFTQQGCVWVGLLSSVKLSGNTPQMWLEVCRLGGSASSQYDCQN